MALLPFCRTIGTLPKITPCTEPTLHRFRFKSMRFGFHRKVGVMVQHIEAREGGVA
jgi:hypothetical protein